MKNKIFSAACVLAAIIAIAFTVHAVQQVPVYGNGFMLIQTGSSVSSTDGTVTNTFTTPYGSLPSISIQSWGALMPGTNTITTLTLTNFVFKCGANAASNTWISVGSP